MHPPKAFPFPKSLTAYNGGYPRLIVINLRPKIDKINGIIMYLGGGSFQVFAEIRIQLGDPKARYFLVPSFCVLLQQQYKLLPLHVIQCDIDVLRLPAHYLGGTMVYLVSHPSSGDPHHRG